MTTVDAPQPPKLQFKVPGAVTVAPPMDIPAPVEQPIASGLAEVATTDEGRQGIVCKDMIDPATLEQCKAVAARLLPAMLKDGDVLITYGDDALKPINQLIDVLMKQIRPANIGPLKDIMTTATLNMKSIKGKYDLSTPDGKKTYDEWEHGRLKKLLHHAHNYIEAMMTDMQSADQQLDKLDVDLKQRYVEIRNNVKYLDQLYEQNEASIYTLIQTIAVMELVVDLAKAQAAPLPDKDPTTGQDNQLKKDLTDLILQMNIKIGEYKGRLFVAWATSPQLRMMRVLDTGLAEKLHEAITVTIYTIKLAMVQWRIQAEAVEGAKAEQNISDATNAALKEVAAAGAATASLVMTAVQTPTILPDTISAMTDSMVLMADNILTAVSAGDQRRNELSTTMAQSKQVLDGSQAKFNQQLVSEIVGSSTKPFELPPSVPTFALTAGS